MIPFERYPSFKTNVLVSVWAHVYIRINNFVLFDVELPLIHFLICGRRFALLSRVTICENITPISMRLRVASFQFTYHEYHHIEFQDLAFIYHAKGLPTLETNWLLSSFHHIVRDVLVSSYLMLDYFQQASSHVINSLDHLPCLYAENPFITSDQR